MLVSPPFLPARAAAAGDADWLDLAMPAATSRLPDTRAPEGSFPLSHQLAWHNGMHIRAPEQAGAPLPVRAIADGTVVFVQPPVAVSTDVGHAQNYNPFDRPGTKTAAWSDNGCVVIEHQSEIGGDGAAPVRVTFYSLVMHLSAIGRTAGAGRRALQSGDVVARKAEIGTAGQIYGHRGQIHFEICCDAANLQRFLGRAPAWRPPVAAPARATAPTADGRTDCVFGSIYFYLPATTPTHAAAAAPTSPLRRGAGGATLGSPLWVRMTYGLGACTFETFDERGVSLRRLDPDADGERSLYRDATARHAAMPAASAATSSPSGWYELLRFGRNLGHGRAAADRDPLPADAAHWRRIAGADGNQLWADLNAPGTFKFSDADFPAVMGWNCIDDDTSPTDQRCDSQHLKELIRDPDAANTARMETASLARRLGDDGVQRRLRRLLCRFPSEWDRGSIATRYAFVKDFEPFKASPEAWPVFVAHLNAMSFAGLPAGYLAADWHWQPKEFLLVLRQCGWKSTTELAHVLHAAPAEGRTRAEAVRVAMNTSMRKYGVDVSKLRESHFLAQVGHETGWWQYREELGNERYFRTMYEIITPAEAAEDYRSGLARRLGQVRANESEGAYAARRPGAVADKAAGLWNGAANAASGGRAGDGPRFRGRGFLQITGRRNYTSYGTYRGRDFVTDPNPRLLGTENHSSCDASGFFWTRESINAVADQGPGAAAVTHVGGVVNRGSAARVPLHDEERHTAFDAIWSRLNDLAP